MTNRLTARIVLCAATLLACVTPASAQLRIGDDVEIRFSGRLHAQFNTSSVDSARSSEFLIRRARIGAQIDIGSLITGKVEPDFGEGEINLKDAWVRLAVHPAFRVTAGQFKRPFDIFELTSSTRILVVERAGGVRGVNSCTGPGGICSFSRFTEKLRFADRDIGILIDGAQGAVSWAASVTNGRGANLPDENGTKSFTGRLEVEAVPDIVLAGNVAAHDYPAPLGDDEYAWALGGDVEIGSFSNGLHVQAGFVTGENWATTVRTDFLTAQTIVTYRVPVTGGDIVGIEPVARVSYGDPDTATDADHGWLLTPGVMIHLARRNYLALNVDYWSPDTGNSEWSLKGQMFFYF